MVNVRNSNVDSILFIRSAEREHSGSYELVLQIENMEDRATVEIRIIGKEPIWEHLLLMLLLLLCLSVRENYYFPIVRSLDFLLFIHSTTKMCGTFNPPREAWASSEREGDRHLGLQRSN